MNQYFKFLHYLFNYFCNKLDRKMIVKYVVDHKKSRISQQAYYLYREESKGICDISMYLK